MLQIYLCLVFTVEQIPITKFRLPYLSLVSGTKPCVSDILGNVYLVLGMIL